MNVTYTYTSGLHRCKFSRRRRAYLGLDPGGRQVRAPQPWLLCFMDKHLFFRGFLWTVFALVLCMLLADVAGLRRTCGLFSCMQRNSGAIFGFEAEQVG